MKSTSIKNKEYRRSVNGFINNIYRNQKSTSKKRMMKPPCYTLIELREWILKQPNFNKLWDGWIESNYNRLCAPSVDRLDDYKPYSFKNIQLITWLENNNKGNYDRKNGINNKANISVIKYDLIGNVLKEYHSVSQASRENNISKSVVFNSCKDGRFVNSDYYFKYNQF